MGEEAADAVETAEYALDLLGGKDQRQAGGPPRPHEVFELAEQAAESFGLHEEAREEELRERRRWARAAGRRAGTVSARWQPAGAAPYLRLSGSWLRAAGFEVGRGVEVEVRSGKLVIRAV